MLEADSIYEAGVTIEGNSTLVLGVSGAEGEGQILFAWGADSTLRLAPGVQLDVFNPRTDFVQGGPIADYETGDTIDLQGLPFVTGATAFVSSGTLTVDSGGSSMTLPMSGIGDVALQASSDGGSGTEVIACFVAGTPIATPAGEVALELLAVGDAVRTVDGRHAAVRWIGRRDYAAAFVAANPQLRPVRIRAGALGAGLPWRDLLVSPGHALLVDGLLVEAGALVNGVSVLREPAGAVRYRHLEFDAHELLLAAGSAAESFVDDDSRGVFQNAHAFVPFGGNATRRALAADGPALWAVWRRIAARAGVAPIPRNGKLRGQVERVDADGMAEGWVTDCADPSVPVELELVGPDGVGMRLLAMRYRIDLDRAGIADGRCGFRMPTRGALWIIRGADGGEVLQVASLPSLSMAG